jgi:hypothetical protein
MEQPAMMHFFVLPVMCAKMAPVQALLLFAQH